MGTSIHSTIVNNYRHVATSSETGRFQHARDRISITTIAATTSDAFADSGRHAHMGQDLWIEQASPQIQG